MPENIQKGIGLTTISQVISMGLQFGLSIILARGLGSNDYGLYGVVQNGIITASSIIDLGVNSAVTKFIADSDIYKEGKESFSILFSTLFFHSFITLFFWLVLFIFSRSAVRIWFDGDYLLYILFALSSPILIFINDLIAALYGFCELKNIAYRMVLQNLLLAGLDALFIWRLNYGVQVATLIYLVVLILMLLLLIKLFKPIFNDGRLIIHRQLQIRRIIKFSLPIGGLYVLDTLIRSAPVILSKAFGINDPTINQKVASLSLAILLGGVAEGVLLIIIKSGFGYVTRWQTQKKGNLIITYVFVMIFFIIFGYLTVFIIANFGIHYFIKITYGAEYLAINNYILLTLAVSMTRSFVVLFRTILYTMELTLKAFFASFLEIVVFSIAITIVMMNNLNSDWGLVLLGISVGTGFIKAVVLSVFSIRELRKNYCMNFYETSILGIKEIIKTFR